MAKTSSINRNEKRRKMAKSSDARRKRLKALISDKQTPMDERFSAVLKLAQMPRNGAKVRISNRCEVTGRPRAYYRKFKMSRIAVRDLANQGLIPGMVKSSW
jgi:small subunit ribosomal protein S14